MATKLTISEAVQALREQDAPSPTSHPSLEALLALHERRLPSEEAEEIQEHFVHCRDCAQRSIELALFLAPPEPASFPLVARFREIILVLRQPLAASLLVATVLSFGALLATRRQIDQLASGEINVPVLAIDQGMRREAGPGTAQPPVDVPSGAVLILTPPLEPKRPEYEVRISTLNGPDRLVWSEQGLQPTSEGSFHLRLPHDLQTGETYRLRIVPGEGQDLTIRVVAPRRE